MVWWPSLWETKSELVFAVFSTNTTRWFTGEWFGVLDVCTLSCTEPTGVSRDMQSYENLYCFDQGPTPAGHAELAESNRNRSTIFFKITTFYKVFSRLLSPPGALGSPPVRQSASPPVRQSATQSARFSPPVRQIQSASPPVRQSASPPDSVRQLADYAFS